MKKLFFLLVFSALCIVGTFAQEFTYNDFDFTINDDDVTVTLLGHVDGFAASGELNIPSVAYWYGNSYTVTVIDNQAFYYNTGLEGPLVIPNTIRRIGSMAFYPCSGFTSLTLPGTLTNIGDFAFSGCSGITEISILATTPPSLGQDPFENFGCPLLTVPCGSLTAYQNSSWNGQFETIIQDCAIVLESDGNTVSVHPNPTHGVVKIEGQNLQNISIYNIIGELIFESEVSGDVFEYDMGKRESGVYLIKVETAENIEIQRVIVRH